MTIDTYRQRVKSPIVCGLPRTERALAHTGSGAIWLCDRGGPFGYRTGATPRTRMRGMTAKELLLKRAPSWSEDEAEVALRAVEHRHATQARPGDIVDDWGNLSAMTRASTARTMRRLAEEEAAAGHDPW
jgi:hypothetical protein